MNYGLSKRGMVAAQKIADKNGVPVRDVIAAFRKAMKGKKTPVTRNALFLAK